MSHPSTYVPAAQRSVIRARAERQALRRCQQGSRLDRAMAAAWFCLNGRSEADPEPQDMDVSEARACLARLGLLRPGRGGPGTGT